jgi:hypothetical protein
MCDFRDIEPQSFFQIPTIIESRLKICQKKKYERYEQNKAYTIQFTCSKGEERKSISHDLLIMESSKNNFLKVSRHKDRTLIKMFGCTSGTHTAGLPSDSGVCGPQVRPGRRLSHGRLSPTFSTVARLLGEVEAAAAGGGGGCRCWWGRRRLLLGEESECYCCRRRPAAGAEPPACHRDGSWPVGDC